MGSLKVIIIPEHFQVKLENEESSCSVSMARLNLSFLSYNDIVKVKFDNVTHFESQYKL